MSIGSCCHISAATRNCSPPSVQEYALACFGGHVFLRGRTVSPFFTIPDPCQNPKRSEPGSPAALLWRVGQVLPSLWQASRIRPGDGPAVVPATPLQAPVDAEQWQSASFQRLSYIA